IIADVAMPRRRGVTSGREANATYNSMSERTHLARWSLNLRLKLPTSAGVAALPALPRLLPERPLAGRKTLATPLTGSADALALGGYQHVTQVVSPGEFSVRGGLIDLFPMGSALPYRIDLLDEEIESIKAFDVDSQRTLYPVPNVRLLPAREFPLDDTARTRFRGRYREIFEGDPSKSALYRDISNGITPGGIEYYLPLFFDATAI